MSDAYSAPKAGLEIPKEFSLGAGKKALAFVLALISALVYFWLFDVLPTFALAFQNSGTDLPLPTKSVRYRAQIAFTSFIFT